MYMCKSSGYPYYGFIVSNEDFGQRITFGSFSVLMSLLKTRILIKSSETTRCSFDKMRRVFGHDSLPPSQPTPYLREIRREDRKRYG